MKLNGRGKDYGTEDFVEETQRIAIGHRSVNVIEPHSLSKDDLIETLKAKILQMQSENAKASTSNKEMPAQLALSTSYSGEARKVRMK